MCLRNATGLSTVGIKKGEAEEPSPCFHKELLFMRKFLFILLSVALITLVACDRNKEPEQAELNLYTSMKESLIMTLVEDFTVRNPDIKVNINIAGAGTLMSQIEQERINGGIIADVIWTSEIPDFYYLKDEGLLLQYTPAGAQSIQNPLNNTEGYFFPARFGTMGIAYNTDIVKTPPASWYDLLTDDYANGFVIADPSTSGTAMMSVAMLNEAFGEQFFHDLNANGTFVGQGSSQVIDAVAAGDIVACLAVDYITFDKAQSGFPIALVYPPEMIVIPSPLAIFKDSTNQDAAKLFADYLISADAQNIIASIGTLPVLEGITVPDKYNIPSVAEANARAIAIDKANTASVKNEIVEMFLGIMQNRQTGNGNNSGAHVQATGEVVISFEFVRQSGAASNQYAVWIEDMDGNLIKSLYASSWTADGGYKTRPDSIALWVERASLANMSSIEVDAISGATPRTGSQSHIWDLTDLSGNTVLQGDYKIFIEGTLRWKNFVLYTGIISIGNDPVTVVAEATFHFEGTDRYDALTADSVESKMITDVIARFTP